MSEPLIHRYDHNHFHGWVVCTKRQGRRFVRYFSDRPKGRRTALRAARAYRNKLVARLPQPSKIKRSYICNMTGVVGVARVKERTRSGKWFIRYVAQWPMRSGKNRRATFSVRLYGESEAFKLAVASRRAGLRDLLN
jgi:hypothetical protein